MPRICGVSISSGKAIFVVLEGNKIVDTKFKKINLEDDTSQNQIQSFYTAVEDFFKQNEIDTVFVKKGNTSGKYSAGSKSFKIEALIQFVPTKVHLIAFQTVAAFLKKTPISVEMESQILEYQKDALKLAFYGLKEQLCHV